MLFEPVIQKCLHPGIRNEHNISALAAVTAIRARMTKVFIPVKTLAAFPAAPGLNKDPCLINKCHNELN
jgi:hypothetical protein